MNPIPLLSLLIVLTATAAFARPRLPSHVRACMAIACVALCVALGVVVA